MVGSHALGHVGADPLGTVEYDSGEAALVSDVSGFRCLRKASGAAHGTIHPRVNASTLPFCTCSSSAENWICWIVISMWALASWSRRSFAVWSHVSDW